MSLADVQCHLDKEGASDLVIDLIMNATTDRVFHESILLAIALLEGGNTTIQVRKYSVLSFYTILIYRTSCSPFTSRAAFSAGVLLAVSA